MRKSKIKRETSETSISISFGLDGNGEVSVDTTIPFLDHMLIAFGRHGRFMLNMKAKGDVEVDPHHLVEDAGIVLGRAIREAIGDGKGIRRFSHTAIPMDEACATVTIDCGGRGYCLFRCSFSDIPLGGIPGSLFEHFFYSLCINAGITAHFASYGQNDHHKVEALFKAFGIGLHEATAIMPSIKDIPSTKGVF